VAPGAAGRTATTKLLPPAAPASLLRRDRLLALLDEALERRLTTVVAEAGFGKSTLLAAWAADVHCAWYSAAPEDASLPAFARAVADALRLRVPALPADVAGAVSGPAGPGADQDEASRARGFAALVCETLQGQLRRDLVLVLDDVHEIAGSLGARQVIEALCRQAPSRFHVVLTSRTELPFPIERLRGQGQVLEIDGADLAFDVEETALLLSTLAGTDDAETALELHRATGGWPAAVRLAVETLRGVPEGGRRAALERIRRPGGPLFAYLASEVFAHEPSEVEELVRTVAPLDRFTAELCEALGAARPDEVLASLVRRGLFVELRGHAPGWYTLGAPVREFAFAHLRLDDAAARSVRLRAARWFEEHDDAEEALRCLAAAGEHSETARVLAAHGPALLAHGAVDAVLNAIGPLPADLRDAQVEQLAGEALQVRGEWDEALACFERAAGGADTLPSALAWRMGLLHQLRGRLDEAMATYDRGDELGAPRDVALLLAWRAGAHWLRANADACRADVERAFAVASAAGDPQALAAAHTVLAMLAALEGDRGANDAHYLRALDYAQQAGDVLQLIRVRTNRGSRHLEEGAYEEAVAELDLALRLADLAGFAAFRALALTNRGEALSKLGRFEEAVADLESARELYERLGSRMVAYPLDKLGEIYRERGDWALSRAAYEAAVAQSEPAGDLQGLVPALAGLARVLVADDPDEAERLADRALSLGPAMGHVHALLAAGWVALARGARDLASQHAVEAAAVAGGRRDRAGLAESLELRVLAAPDPARDSARLEEALAIWRDLGNPVGEARVKLIEALLGGDADAARRAEQRLRELGVRGYRLSHAPLIALDGGPAVAVQSLGRFRVLRGGEPVPLAAWQSRKARDLLKILVARRGRPTPRDYLMEALWPEQSPAPLGNRLSVLLSTVRSVLDPEKRHEPDEFVGGDKSAIWLQSENVAVDVERFLAAAAEALDVRRAGGADAEPRLVAAEAMYSGDFLEEDAYEDWAIVLREEARAAYTEVVRGLAEDAASRGDTDAAGRYYLRVLERDPYDEPAHLGLVSALESAGRHGEARRCFRTYCARMDTIGVESAPFPGAAA
jgi:ATP/maltotriose-dependent transcriptional regulator MalT/DNA-binding SARP family transcriptional activator